MQFTSVRLSTHDLGMTREELALATLLSLSPSLSLSGEPSGAGTGDTHAEPGGAASGEPSSLQVTNR